MNKIRTLIVDDEAPARASLRLLAARDPQIEIVGEARNGHEAVALIRRLKPALVFLDVQMPELDGFEVLAQVGLAASPTVIFVTAYDAYALQAFEVQALDYLLKPFSDERFHKALQRAKAHLARNPTNAPPTLERLVIKSGGRVSFLTVAEIDWIEAADYYVLLHVGAKAHLLRETITNLEARLDQQTFLRIHRSTIVNLNRVRDWQAHSSGEGAVTLHDGTQLKLSRRRRKALETQLAQSRT
ncbi:MAG: response regulator transcription factor [Acidobacteria bacterium]|nr:response regulator transcription factor [Acidobacteriota bacterium]